MSGPEAILVSVEEAARMLSVCRTTFYKLLSSGEIRAVKHRRRTPVPVEAVKMFAASLPGMQDDEAHVSSGNVNDEQTNLEISTR